MNAFKLIHNIFDDTSMIFHECSDKMDQVYAAYPEKATALQTGLNLSACKLDFLKRSNEAYDENIKRFFSDPDDDAVTIDAKILENADNKFKDFQRDFFAQLEHKMIGFLMNNNDIPYTDEVTIKDTDIYTNMLNRTVTRRFRSPDSGNDRK